MSDVLRDRRDEIRAALDLEIGETDFKRLEKQARDLSEEISEGLLWNLKDNLSDWIASEVRESAQRAIEAILAGNMPEARRYLGLSPEGHDGRAWFDRPWFNNHMALHEFGGVGLRRAIVEARRDDITDGRIADLEGQLEGLCKKYYRMEHAEMPQLRDKLREAERELEQWRAADARAALNPER